MKRWTTKTDQIAILHLLFFKTLFQVILLYFQNPIASYTVPMHLENWFKVDVVLRKRDELKALILQLKNSLNPTLKVPDIDEDVPIQPKEEEKDT